MKRHRLTLTFRGALPLLTCALSLTSLSLLRAQDGAADNAGVDIQLIDGRPVVGVDGHGAVEVAPSPAGPWTPFREAMPGEMLHAELPMDAQHRFVRIRRPDGRLTDVLPAIPGLSPQPPPWHEILVSGYDGKSATIQGTIKEIDASTPKLIPFFVDDTLVVMRDDGRDGDAVAGDGIFTGETPIDIKELERARAFMASLPDNIRQVPAFAGRGIVAEPVDLGQSENQLDDLLAGKPVKFPIPLGIAPSIRPIPLPGPGDPPRPALTPCGELPTWQKTLLITDLTVVEDPVRTFDPCTGAGTPMGAWTFGRLMTDMANTPVSGISASDFARRWLRSWQLDQMINNDPVPNRGAGMTATILQSWQNASGGPGRPLDMSRAPFRLLAVVNRLDLRGNVTYGGGRVDPCHPPCLGGEARFVFCFCDPRSDQGGGYNGGGSTGGGVIVDPPAGVNGEFLVIMEYCVPRNNCRELKAWAQAWADLQCIPFGAGYNTALQRITDVFAKPNAAPGRPNNSALNQLRTNENLLDPLWELREFKIFDTDSDAGHLRPVTVKQTPREDVDGTAVLANYINTTLPAPPNHTVPLEWGPGPMLPFLGGRAVMAPISVTSGSAAWATTGFTVPNMIRHDFALNTCNGCHSTETATRFTHVGCRIPGQPAPLSGFLKGDGAGGPLVVNIPGAPAVTVKFFDLQRREQDLIQFLLTPCGLTIFDTGLTESAVH